MSKDQSELAISKDVEAALSEGDEVHTIEKMKKIRIPNVQGSEVAIYVVFTSMFIVGWITLNSCPVSRMIPIYLIVAGFTGVLTKCIVTTSNRFVFNLVITLLAFDLVWQIVGSYFVYKEYQPNYEVVKGAYCNRTAYLLAFWMITIQYTLLGLFLILSVCYLLMRGDFIM